MCKMTPQDDINDINDYTVINENKKCTDESWKLTSKSADKVAVKDFDDNKGRCAKLCTGGNNTYKYKGLYY